MKPEETPTYTNLIHIASIWYHYKSQKSRMWSKRKRSWFDGPHIPTGLKFVGASGVRLNHSSVLFIGVSKMPFEITLNDMSIIYNFELKVWTLQESFDLPEIDLFKDDGFIYQTSCSIIDSKHEKR